MTLRILHLLTQADLAGTEREVFELIRELDPKRYRHEVCLLEGEGPLTDLCRNAGIPISHLELSKRGVFLSLWRLYHLLRNRPYDIVHLYGIKGNVLGRIASRLAGKRAVVGSIRGITNDRSINRLRIWADRGTFPLVRSYISNSEAVIEYLIQKGFPRQKLCLARTGLSPEPFRHLPSKAEARAALGISPEPRPVIVCTANLRPVKNHHLLISACGLLRRRGLDFETLLVGDGPEREDVERMIEQEGLTQFFRFMGQRNDVPLILAASDLFVLSSLSEGLPRSIMEAMASLLPVVATDVGGVGELVRHGFTGYLVPSEDTAALAERMAEILENPALGKTMGEAGYQKLLEEFNMDRMAADMDRIYTDIASSA